MVRNLTQDDATMQERFTIPRGALELDNTLGAKLPAARSAEGARKAQRPHAGNASAVPHR
jgi:hypothetical protein